jgi:hypothetical protein
MKNLSLFCSILAAFLSVLFFVEAYGQQSIFLLIMGLLCAVVGAFVFDDYNKTKNK